MNFATQSLICTECNLQLPVPMSPNEGFSQNLQNLLVFSLIASETRCFFFFFFNVNFMVSGKRSILESIHLHIFFYYFFIFLLRSDFHQKSFMEVKN